MYTSTTNTSDLTSEKLKTPAIFTTAGKLKQEVKEHKKKALEYLEKGYLGATIRELTLLQDGNITQVNQYMRDLDIPIADLILQREIPEALEPLFQGIRPENRLAVIISGKEDDSRGLKKFIERSLHLSYDQYQATSETKRNILTQLIQIEPLLRGIIQEEINIASSSDRLNQLDTNTLKAFRKDFEAVCSKEGCQNSFLFRPCNNEESPNRRITGSSHP